MAHEQTRNRESQAMEPRRGRHISGRGAPFRMMGELADEILEGWSLQSLGDTLGSFSPQVDMFERNGKLVVRADLPGVDINNIRVTLTDESVIIEGERRDEREERGASVYRFETTYGRFRREIPLPDGVDSENAMATFNNGVLEITLDISQASSGRRQIPIQKQEAAGRAGQSEQPSESEQSGTQSEQQPTMSGQSHEQENQTQPGEKAA
jgi:HSP20 family molecular chaperone IbpA